VRRGDGLFRRDVRDERDDLDERGPSGVAVVVATRLIAAALLAWLVPVAGLFALGALVFMWVVRSRIDVTSVLIVYALALWLIPSRYTVGPFAVTGAMAIAFLAILLWAYGRALPESRVAHGPSPTNRAVCFFLVVTLVGYVTVMVRPIAELDQRSADRNLAVLVGLCGLAAAICDNVHTKRYMNRLIAVLVGGATIVAVIGFLQYFARFDVAQYLHPPGFTSTGEEAFIYQRAGFRRVAGTARHPIELGVALAATLPLALHLATYARTLVGRNAARIATLAIIGAIPLALSRSAVLSTALVALLLLPTFSPRRRFTVVAGAAVFLLVMPLFVPGIFGTIGKLLQGKEGTGSLQTRGNATEVAFDLISEKPWFGYGFAPAVGPSPVIIDNQYLVTGIEQGLLGLTALGAVVFTGIGTARRARRMTDDPELQDLGQSFVATIAAVALGGFGLNILRFPITAGLLFVGVGGAGALLRIVSTADNVSADPGRRELIEAG
jgi:O-antigen ligase/polysaccharide polymerase Wzy-like membrane protein